MTKLNVHLIRIPLPGDGPEPKMGEPIPLSPEAALLGQAYVEVQALMRKRGQRLAKELDMLMAESARGQKLFFDTLEVIEPATKGKNVELSDDGKSYRLEVEEEQPGAARPQPPEWVKELTNEINQEEQPFKKSMDAARRQYDEREPGHQPQEQDNASRTGTDAVAGDSEQADRRPTHRSGPPSRRGAGK